jgi:hypothetical protein
MAVATPEVYTFLALVGDIYDSTSEGLERRRKRGLASSVSFQQAFGGASPRRRKRARWLRILNWRRIKVPD